MNNQILEIREQIVRKKNRVKTLLKRIHQAEDIPVYLGPKTFDKNWDKGWNKDGR